VKSNICEFSLVLFCLAAAAYPK